MLPLLKRYLIKLEINKAQKVQILADGALWIWNNVKPMLQRLGVKAGRIIETLDYFHAIEYVTKLIHEMPNRIGKKEKSIYMTQYKEWLWNGQVHKIVAHAKTIIKRPGELVKRWIKYLAKH